MNSRFPNWPVLAALLTAWTALFHFQGNSSFGYIDTRSLFVWLNALYGANSDDALGWVVVPLIALLIWTRRDEFARVPKQPSLLPLGLFTLAAIFHLAGSLLQQARLSVVGFGLGLYALTGLVWGTAWLRAAAFPFSLLAFCIPLTAYTDGLTLPLRLIATRLSTDFCNGILGLHLIREGTLVFDTLPSGQKGFEFDVAPACSGIRSLTVVLLLTLTFGYLQLDRWWRRGVLLLSAIPLAVLGNVARLVTVFAVGSRYGQEAGARIETNLGFVTLLVALGGVMLISRWLSDPITEAAPPAPEPLRVKPASLGVCLAAVALVFGLIAWGGSALAARQRLGAPGVRLSRMPLFGEDGGIARTNSVYLPTMVPGYTFESGKISPTELHSLPADTTFGRAIYTGSDGFTAQATAVLMGGDRTSIHRPEYCLTGQGWRIRSKQEVTLANPDGSSSGRTVQRFDGGMVSSLEGRRQELAGVYVFWFVADGQRSASHWERQWWMIRDLVTKGVLQRWAYISFFAPCPPGREDEAFRRVAQLIGEIAPAIEVSKGALAGGQTFRP